MVSLSDSKFPALLQSKSVRLASSHLYQPFEQDKMGTLQSLFGKPPDQLGHLFICLHPEAAAGVLHSSCTQQKSPSPSLATCRTLGILKLLVALAGALSILAFAAASNPLCKPSELEKSHHAAWDSLVVAANWLCLHIAEGDAHCTCRGFWILVGADCQRACPAGRHCRAGA